MRQDTLFIRESVLESKRERGRGRIYDKPSKR